MKTVNKWIDDFRLGNNLMLGVWVLIFSGLIIIVFLPWAYTRSSFLPSFDQSGQIGDTFNGIAGPFIALLVALLTYLAFYVAQSVIFVPRFGVGDRTRLRNRTTAQTQTLAVIFQRHRG